MNKKTKDAPVILAGSGSLQGEKWIINDSLSIGRDQDCEIMIENRKVSRHHARIYSMDTGVFIEDLQSKNGTAVDHVVLQNNPVKLEDGAKIFIALTQELTYYTSDATIVLNLHEKTEALNVVPAKESLIGLQIDERSRRIKVNNQEILPPLSKAQFILLDLLVKKTNLVVSREMCIKTVWGEEGAYEVSNQALDALIRRLRVRIAEIDKEHSYIVTVRGHGLRFENRNLDN